MIGSFTLVRNESEWIGGHLEMWLPILSEMVFFDGNSTDGTQQIILDVAHNHPMGHKVKLFTDKDPKDLTDDYVRVFNECLGAVESQYAAFIHPDMIPVNAGYQVDPRLAAHFMNVESYAGDSMDSLLRFTSGRSDKWKNIYQKKPDIGAHYFGHYGAWNEDVYFSEITGDSHTAFEQFNSYPYKIGDSGLKILHFSDVRPYERRVDKMAKTLRHNGWMEADREAVLSTHPRVTLIPNSTVDFSKEIPADSLAAIERFKKNNAKYEAHRRILA